MSEAIMKRLADLRVHDDTTRTQDLQKKVAAMDTHALDQLSVHTAGTGTMLLLDSPGDVPCVLELAVSGDGEDCVSTLFVAHPVFNNRQTYLEARQELLLFLYDVMESGPLGLWVMCPLRKRRTSIRDLGLMQLVDLSKSIVDHAFGVKPIVEKPKSSTHVWPGRVNISNPILH